MVDYDQKGIKTIREREVSDPITRVGRDENRRIEWEEVEGKTDVC